MADVAQILNSKVDPQVHAVTPATTVYAALRLMADKGIGAVLVQEGEDIRGIFTERDYARKIELEGRSARDTAVQEVMTCAVLFVQHNDTKETCMQLMSSKRLRHLPVLRDGQLIGMLSMRDLVQQIITEQQATISQLEHYIHGHPRAASA